MKDPAQVAEPQPPQNHIKKHLFGRFFDVFHGFKISKKDKRSFSAVAFPQLFPLTLLLYYYFCEIAIVFL